MNFNRFEFSFNQKFVSPVTLIGLRIFEVNMNIVLYTTSDNLGNRLSRGEIQSVLTENNVTPFTEDEAFFIKDGNNHKYLIIYFIVDDTYSYEKLTVV